MREENVYLRLIPESLLLLVRLANGGTTNTIPVLLVPLAVKDHIGIPLANPANQVLPALVPHR